LVRLKKPLPVKLKTTTRRRRKNKAQFLARMVTTLERSPAALVEGTLLETKPRSPCTVNII
jgi:hypothetical protein